MNWLEKCRAHQAQLLEDLSGLIAIPSVRTAAQPQNNAPFGKECRKALDYMMELGRREGFTVTDIDGYACVLSYGEGTESIGVLGHLDVVPAGSGWTKEPFALTKCDDVLFGRGVSDDKGPGIAAFYAMKMIKEAQLPLSKKVMLIYGCDEESGMECMDYYVKHGEIPQMGFVPDADFPVIYGEKGAVGIELNGTCESVIRSMSAGERANIVIEHAEATLSQWDSEKSQLFDFYLQSNQLQGSIDYQGSYVTIMMRGKSAHAATPYEGVNAALHMLNFIGSAFADEFAQKTYALLSDWRGSGIRCASDGAYMGFLTLNTGIINIKDSEANILLDIRYPNDLTADEIIQNVKEAISECNYPLYPLVKKQVEPLFVDPNSELVTTLMDVYRTYSNDHFHPAKTIGGGTYAKKLANFVAYGPEFPHHNHDAEGIGGVHQPDEGIYFTNLQTAAAIYAEAIYRLAK